MLRCRDQHRLAHTLRSICSFDDPQSCRDEALPSCVRRLLMIFIHIRSSPDGPLQPTHDAFAEVPCDVDRWHLVQLGITDFFGDLLSSSYAIVFPVDHELISVGRAFRQHRFVEALDRTQNSRIKQVRLIVKKNPCSRWTVNGNACSSYLTLGAPPRRAKEYRCA